MEIRQTGRHAGSHGVPDGWRQDKLSELFTFRNGVNADKRCYGTGTKFINVSEIIACPTIRETDITGRISLPPAQLNAFEVHFGDVLFNRTSETQEEVGLASVYLGREPVVFGGFVIRARLVQNDVLPKYVSYALRSAALRSQIIARGQGAVHANLSQRDLSTVVIALPPKAEQQAIAEALSDADALIESLEQLIAKKRHIKQGVMRELLTAKKRLPGFRGEWQTKRLADVAEIRSGGTPSTNRAEFWDGGIEWCTPTDITGLNGSKYLSRTSRTISALGLMSSSAELIPSRSIVMTSRATIGECAINVVPMATNQGFKNFVPLRVTDIEFLYYLLLTLKLDFISLCGGSTFLEIGKAQISAFEVALPADKLEQTAIASILSDLDAEIDVLDAKLTKAHLIKQGMMQELLTGRIRLV